MNRLETMSTFVEVVNKSSFTVAAKALNISRALVSRHINDLELHLGTRLLVRTTRSVNLTETGKSYYDFCARILTEIHNAEGAIVNRNEEVEGRLSIIVPKWIGNREVADAVAAFCKQYPKIRMELMLGKLSEKTYDFIERGFDVALQTHAIPDTLVRVKKIATIRYVTVGAPELIERVGTPAAPRDLAGLPCAIQTADPIWRFEAPDVEPVNVRVDAAFASNAHLVLRRAALHGLGFAMLPLQVVHKDIASGKLVAVLTDWVMPERPLYASYAPGGPPPRKIRVLTGFLADWFKRHPLA
jgi:DNA-binding transcriptional LysR family regulator